MVLVLEWKFEPEDYFEDELEVALDGIAINIKDGNARAEVDLSVYEADPDLRQRLHDFLEDHFRGVEVQSHRSYKLSRSIKTIINPDGSKHHFLEAEPITITVSVSSPDIRITGEDGQVLADSRADRLMERQELGAAIAIHRPNNPTLAAMTHFYQEAVRDPADELVHLYGMREALKIESGREADVQSLLGISKRDWKRFGALCNDLPLKQGRHTGKKYCDLRDATEAELSEARRLAKSFITAYIKFLER